MNLDLYMIEADKTLIDAFKKIEANTRYFVIVVKGKKAVGTFTDGDVRRSLIKGIPVTESVYTACNKNFYFLKDTQTPDDAIELMQKCKRRFIPVLNDEGELVNIVTKESLEYVYLQDKSITLSYDFLSIDYFQSLREIHVRPWGFFKTTVLNDYFQSKIIHVKPHGKLSLQMHFKREEYWIINHGEGNVQIEDEVFSAKVGNSFFIPKQTKHRLENTSDSQTLIITEIQLGDYFGEDDIIRLEDEYGRT